MKGKRMRAFAPHPHLPLPLKSKKPKEEEAPGDEMAVTLTPEVADEDVYAVEEEEDREELLVALVEHRTKKVDKLRREVDHYTSLLKEAERKQLKAERKLARFRAEAAKTPTSDPLIDERPRSKPKLFIPSSANFFSRAPQLAADSISGKNDSAAAHSAAITFYENPLGHESSSAKKMKREPEEEHDLIPQICSSSLAFTFQCKTSSVISNQHRRRLRSLALSPADDTLFVTSALDGMLNLWQIKEKGLVASLLGATDCASPSQKRWPEDIAWHPNGGRIFCAYNADGADPQLSVVELDKFHGRAQVAFLDEKPHAKGSINSIAFLPGEGNCFVTGGADHAVVLWKEVEDRNLWKSKALHKFFHSSAVMGVAGMLQKDVVLSAGYDRRILGFDIQAETLIFRRLMENKCMNVLPNPCDLNLFMVQTGAPENQLRLFDFRMGVTELHAFGWKQETSESQSALISQAWSPDGLFITSGSADPMIHIFDIRYNSPRPSQSIKAHQKRVFKALWHQSLPLLVSVSSDSNIGMHKIA